MKKEIVFYKDVPQLGIAKISMTDDSFGNADSSDILVPRLELAQALTTATQRDEPTYIDGLEQGFFFNSVTRAVYGTTLKLIPILYWKVWNVWLERSLGGGFRGSFHTQALATASLSLLSPDDEIKNPEIVETPQIFGLIAHEALPWELVVLSLPRTKAKVAKALLNQAAMLGPALYSTSFKLTSSKEKKGDKAWWSLVVAPSTALEPNSPVWSEAKRLSGELIDYQKSNRLQADMTDRAEVEDQNEDQNEDSF